MHTYSLILKKLGTIKYSTQRNQHKTLFYSIQQLQMFPQRKFHFSKMFRQRKFYFNKMFPQRSF